MQHLTHRFNAAGRLLAAGAVALSLASTSARAGDQGHGAACEACEAGTHATHEMTFRQGTMIEAAFVTFKDGVTMADLQERYLQHAFPLAQEYGLKPLGTFNATKTEHGDPAHFWGFFEWPDAEACERLHDDPRFKPLRAIRDEMVDVKMVYLAVPETKTVTLTDGKMYEFAGVWVNQHHRALLDEYFAAAGPFLAENGVGFPGEFQVIGTNPEYPLQPHVAMLIEWPSAEVKQAWFEGETFREVGWKRALALDRLFIVESSFNFPEPMAEAQANAER